MATKYIVDNVLGQTINGKLLQPYKVYTALLNQNTGDEPQTINSGVLEIGFTYEITDYISGDDFTNVGASLNETGIKFVATGITPNVWTNSSELSYNGGAPVVKILEDNIGTLTFTYNATGDYGIVNSDGWDPDKVWFTLGGLGSIENMASYPSKNSIYFDNVELKISSLDSSDVETNGQLWNTPIEIRVYN
jgi:hypothetical protein